MDITGSDAWHDVQVVAETGSTNADVAAAADRGEPEGLVIVAERQTAGRGRLDRTWVSPPGSGLTFSVLLRPAVPRGRLGWLPLLAGLAVAEAVDELAEVSARLKWPNDVLVGDRKLAGVLAEARPAAPKPEGAPRHQAPPPIAVVVGIGLNVDLAEADLPVPTATSMLLEGGRSFDRTAVLEAVLRVFGARYHAWTEANGDAEASGLRAAYTVRCSTVGHQVDVELPARTLRGEAVGIDADGRLRVNDLRAGTTHTVGAGDVVHLV